MSPYPTAKPLSATFIARCRVIRTSMGWSALRFANEVTAAGYGLSHQMVRNQETRSGNHGYSVSLDQAMAVCAALGRTLDDILSGPVCSACADEPPLNTRCLICEAENRG